MMARRSGLRLVLALAGLGAGSPCTTPSCPAIILPRDFAASPAIVDQPSFTRLYALGDVHGGYDRMVALLARWGLVRAQPATSDTEWTGADATLVVTGDLIDKGSQSVEVVDFMRALELSAAMHGGRVIVTLGNHEAEFLADPYNAKADTFDRELGSAGLDPCVVATTEARGVWLRARPLGARVGDWNARNRLWAGAEPMRWAGVGLRGGACDRASDQHGDPRSDGEFVRSPTQSTPMPLRM